MGLSDPDRILEWRRRIGREGDDPHEWTIIGTDTLAVECGDRAIRAACRLCGLVRRKPMSLNAEMFIDLSGPCPGDSGYWRELQNERARSRTGP